MTAPAISIECKHFRLHGSFSFTIEVDNECDNLHGYAHILLCRECYNMLKGEIFQDSINEAVRFAIPFGRK